MADAINYREFELELNGEMERVDQMRSLTMQLIAARLLTGLVMKSPVLTGTHRGNWQITLQQPADGIVAVADVGGPESGAASALASSTIQAGMAKASQVGPGDDIWATNNLPYASVIEDGYGSRQGKHTVALTIAEIEHSTTPE